MSRYFHLCKHCRCGSLVDVEEVAKGFYIPWTGRTYVGLCALLRGLLPQRPRGCVTGLPAVVRGYWTYKRGVEARMLGRASRRSFFFPAHW